MRGILNLKKVIFHSECHDVYVMMRFVHLLQKYNRRHVIEQHISALYDCGPRN